jgi:hypothetical protein
MPSFTDIHNSWDFHTSNEMQEYFNSPQFDEDLKKTEPTSFQITDEASKQEYLRSDFRGFIKQWRAVGELKDQHMTYYSFGELAERLEPKKNLKEARAHFEKLIKFHVNFVLHHKLNEHKGKVTVVVRVNGGIEMCDGWMTFDEMKQVINAAYLECPQAVRWNGKNVKVYCDDCGLINGSCVNGFATMLQAPIALSPLCGDVIFQLKL